MKLSYYLKRSLSMPPHILVRKAIRKLSNKSKFKFKQHKDRRLPTYLTSTKASSSGLLHYLVPVDLKGMDSFAEQNRELSNLHLEHRFDLLGSGWTNVKHGTECLGIQGIKYNSGFEIEIDKQGKWLEKIINRSNIIESQKIWRLVDEEYVAIDWQLDFKSGYRWSENTWYNDILYGNYPGVDIKVPWELARMQHLVQLAWAFAFSSNGYHGFLAPATYAKEFRNQVLDFISTNPPRYGVNWLCTMDVGIRVANWLLAYDLFCAYGYGFDEEFLQVFMRSIYEHGTHCIENLEYTPELRSNHYLSDIAGLLFTAAYLPRNSEIDRWLAFSVQELISEMNHEFNQDGSNFEASTSYHRLSTEIMLYCSILAAGLQKDKRKALAEYSNVGHSVMPKLKKYSQQIYQVDKSELFPSSFWERLEKAGEFTLHCMTVIGIPQIGDNDSGRFFKVWPSFIKTTTHDAVKRYQNLHGYSTSDIGYWDENILDHSHLSSAIGLIFNRRDLQDTRSVVKPEGLLLKNWLGIQKPSSYHDDLNTIRPAAQNVNINIKDTPDIYFERLSKELGSPNIYEFRSQTGGQALNEGLEIFAYQDFGLYLFRSSSIFLVVRCGSIGQNGNGGHAHNDQLSIELHLDGQAIIRDPGTFLYTPFPEIRNRFRSTLAHFTPLVDEIEQNEWLQGPAGLFNLKNKAKQECLHFSKKGFVGRHYGFGKPVYRVITVHPEKITITDFGSNKILTENKIFSNGYGKWVQ